MSREMREDLDPVQFGLEWTGMSEAEALTIAASLLREAGTTVGAVECVDTDGPSAGVYLIGVDAAFYARLEAAGGEWSADWHASDYPQRTVTISADVP